MSERSFASLARALGLTTVGHRAEGEALGTTITLLDTRAPDRTAAIAISCPLVRPMDLRITVASGSATPPARTEEHGRFGEDALDTWLAIWGKGELPRARALLEPALVQGLRSATELAGVRLNDALLTAYVPVGASLETQREVLARLVELRGLVHAATRRVPVAPLFAEALPAFQRSAERLGVEATTCPFGLYGVVDGCVVDVFRFLPASKEDHILLLHVHLPTKLEGDWLLNSHLGRAYRERIRSILATLTGLGPRPGWFRFGSRFRVARGALGEVAASLGGLHSLGSLELRDVAFLNVSPEKIVTGVRMRDMGRPPDVETLARRLVAMARELHRSARPRGDAPAGTPYR